MREGPEPVISYRCHGCKYLRTEEWEEECDNDFVDDGTSATCMKLDKEIAVYYYSHNKAPDWCPYLEKQPDPTLPAWHTAQAFHMVESFSILGIRIAAGVSGDPEVVLGPAFAPDGRYIPCSMSLDADGWSYFFDFTNFGGKTLSCDATWEIPDELKSALLSAAEYGRDNRNL